MSRVETESGAVYEFDGNRVRRVNPSHVKRGDGEWLTLVSRPTVEVGSRMVLVVESLARYGGDDFGTPSGLVSPVTTRVTTRVVRVVRGNPEGEA